MDQDKQVSIPDEVVLTKVYVIRGHKVMIDRDLAELYGVETRVLNQAVRRNLKRFPDDFMFQMTDQELENWKSQIVISNTVRMGIRKTPLVFTEQGIAMLSSVLNSERAILVNIQIIRVFTKMRELVSSHKDILLALEQLQNKNLEHEEKILLIFEYLRKLHEAKQSEIEFKDRPRIGFRK